MGSVPDVVAFLSDAWVEALDTAARAHAELAARTADLQLVVEQRIDGGPGHDPLVFHVTFDRGAVTVTHGPADVPTLTFTQDRATARAIATGEASAQRAFMTGQLRVGGDLQSLLAAQDALTGLGDVFAAVRATTDFGTA